MGSEYRMFLKVEKHGIFALAFPTVTSMNTNSFQLAKRLVCVSLWLCVLKEELPRQLITVEESWALR